MERKDDKMLTFIEAAEIAGVTTAALRLAAKKQTLKAIKRGRDWLVSHDALETWIADDKLHIGGRKRVTER